MRTRISANWTRAVLVCAKCSKKVGGGFGAKGRTSLAKALRKELGVKKGRRASVGVAEVGCLKLCPKGAVVMVDASRPGEWMLVRPGTAVSEVAALLAGGGEKKKTLTLPSPAGGRGEEGRRVLDVFPLPLAGEGGSGVAAEG